MMNRYLLTIGSFRIEWYSALILVGSLIAILMILKEAKRYNYSTDFVFNMCFWGFIGGILGARIYYVLFNLDMYNSFWEACKIWEGGLAIHGGIIAGLIVVILYCKKYNVRTIRMLDFVAPALLLAQAIGRWGNFFNMEAYGTATTYEKLKSFHIPEFIINGMNIEGVYHYPTFLFEFLWCIIGVILILIVRRLKKTKVGHPIAIYLLWYGIGRFFIESLRTDSLMLGGFKMAQIVSIIMIIIGILIIMINSRKTRYEDLYEQDNNQVIKF